MSYCRWSSNNWDCDLFCYESDRGYTTHVASYRKIGATPIPIVDITLLLNGKMDEFMAARRAQRQWLDAAARVPIGLPCDGQSFDDETIEEFLDRVQSLRDMGYHVSDYVLDTIRSEIAANNVSRGSIPQGEVLSE